MTDRTVRVGFLGTGFMGQLAHLDNFCKVDGCTVAALAELRPELARQVAQRYNVPTVYADHEQLLADESIDAVVMSQPFHRNVPLGRQVLEAGKHLFTEKPMAARSDDARELVERAESRGLVYAVGFMKRYDPGMQLARRLVDGFIESGELGSITTVDTTCFLGDWLNNPGSPIGTDEAVPRDDIHPRYPDFLPESLHADYDHFLNIYSHNVNLLHYLLDEAPVEVLSAHRRGKTYAVTMASGEALVTLRGAPGPRSRRWEEDTVVHFEGGRVEIASSPPMNRQQSARVTVCRRQGDNWTETRMHPPVEWAFYRQARGFVQAVAERVEPINAARRCLADVTLMEDVFRKLIKD